MSLKAMHEGRRNSSESDPCSPEPVILPENLLKRAEEALKALKLEQARRTEAEQRAASEAEKNRTLQRLLTELSETSDSELPTKLSEMLKEQEGLLSSVQEQNRQLRKKLQDAADTAQNDKKASDRRIARLEADVTALERILKYNKFDKEQYLRELESWEKALKHAQEALKSDRADFNSRVQSKAQEIEQDTIADYEARKAQCEAERERLIAQQQAIEAEQQKWLQAEKEKIDNEIKRQVAAYKAELDGQTAKERAEHAQQHDKMEKELESNWKARNIALAGRFAAVSGLVAAVGLISGIVALVSAVIALVHGLLPFIIKDGREIGGWLGNDWNAIFGQAFAFPQSLLPVLQFALPLIFLIIIGIWTAMDFDVRKWVVFADEMSIAAIGTGTGISAVFGRQLSEMFSVNTVMFPIAVYLLYVLIRWLWEIEAIQSLGKWCIVKPIVWWKDLEPNQKTGNAILVATIIAAVLMVRHWMTE